ncbi:YxeA family protein [Lactococcus nasutitermitis]|uniref:YxeA family protein n=1 Tax=Lactococcus nasutitermitis TaxID=1652957 RepID=A0ABV9JC21_9LACT|nr:YxeA family protein [Lactococcus nasutitermitis]
MKKLATIIVVLALIVGAGFAWYKVSYGGETYYVKITENGKKVMKKDDTGKSWVFYDYSQKAFNKNGKEKALDFSADHNLRQQAYLKVTDNKTKGVTNWEEVKQNQVPTKALTKLN